LANDKTLESINIKTETLSSALKNQLSFNKMFETQLAQIVAAVPTVDSMKISQQPEARVENVNLVAIGWGNPSRRPSRTNHVGRSMCQKANTWGGLTTATQGDLGVPMISCSIYDCPYNQALCDLGASINIMPKVIFEQLQYPALSPTLTYVQLTDSTI
jgi:hypothetical protein